MAQPCVAVAPLLYMRAIYYKPVSFLVVFMLFH